MGYDRTANVFEPRLFDHRVLKLGSILMGSENLYAVETARRVLRAIAAKHDPDPADVEGLRRLAPPLAQLPAHELAARVMQLAKTISAVATDSGDQSASDILIRKLSSCGLRRAPRPRSAHQLRRSASKRRE
jgi:hypothetical protein